MIFFWLIGAMLVCGYYCEGDVQSNAAKFTWGMFFFNLGLSLLIWPVLLGSIVYCQLNETEEEP